MGLEVGRCREMDGGEDNYRALLCQSAFRCIAHIDMRDCRYTKHGNRMTIIQMKPELARTLGTAIAPYHDLNAYTST
jgi:hypothetical protein